MVEYAEAEEVVWRDGTAGVVYEEFGVSVALDFIYVTRGPCLEGTLSAETSPEEGRKTQKGNVRVRRWSP